MNRVSSAARSSARCSAKRAAAVQQSGKGVAAAVRGATTCARTATARGARNQCGGSSSARRVRNACGACCARCALCSERNGKPAAAKRNVTPAVQRKTAACGVNAQRRGGAKGSKQRAAAYGEANGGRATREAAGSNDARRGTKCKGVRACGEALRVRSRQAKVSAQAARTQACVKAPVQRKRRARQAAAVRGGEKRVNGMRA